MRVSKCVNVRKEWIQSGEGDEIETKPNLSLQRAFGTCVKTEDCFSKSSRKSKDSIPSFLTIGIPSNAEISLQLRYALFFFILFFIVLPDLLHLLPSDNILEDYRGCTVREITYLFPSIGLTKINFAKSVFLFLFPFLLILPLFFLLFC